MRFDHGPHVTASNINLMTAGSMHMAHDSAWRDGASRKRDRASGEREHDIRRRQHQPFSLRFMQNLTRGEIEATGFPVALYFAKALIW